MRYYELNVNWAANALLSRITAIERLRGCDYLLKEKEILTKSCLPIALGVRQMAIFPN